MRGGIVYKKQGYKKKEKVFHISVFALYLIVLIYVIWDSLPKSAW